MKTILITNTTNLSFLHEPPSWKPNSIRGYYEHQKVLERFILFCLSKGWNVELPIFDGSESWDYGIDIIINGKAIDLKAFALREDRKTKTFDSPAYNGKSRNPNALTEWLVFAPLSQNPEEWEVAPFKRMQKSYYNLPPFFWKADVISFRDFSPPVPPESGFSYVPVGEVA